MNILYHVDRVTRLSQGELLLPKTLAPIRHTETLERLFASNLSSHGIQYLSSAPNNEVFMEIVFEYVRLASFPTKPSRFQSVFAFEKLEDARNFLTRKENSNLVFSRIWQIEGEVLLRADMRLLTMTVSLLDMMDNAYKYWSEEISNGAIVEVLLQSAKALNTVG